MGPHNNWRAVTPGPFAGYPAMLGQDSDLGSGETAVSNGVLPPDSEQWPAMDTYGIPHEVPSATQAIHCNASASIVTISHRHSSVEEGINLDANGSTVAGKLVIYSEISEQLTEFIEEVPVEPKHLHPVGKKKGDVRNRRYDCHDSGKEPSLGA